MMIRNLMYDNLRLMIFLVVALSVAPLNGLAASEPQSGAVDATSGVPDKDIRYEDFRITDDGFITGYVVNGSDKMRAGLSLDIWTKNSEGTRILWRKILNIGDLGPHEKRMVKEPYGVDSEDPAKTEIEFRIHTGANFRNK